MEKIYVCLRCDHEWIDTIEHNCEWCNSPSYYINIFNNPLELSESENLDPLSGKIIKTKNICKDFISNGTKKNVCYTYRRECN